MLFADLTTNPADSWMTLIIQGGALAILAYHFLVGQPKMLREMNDCHERMIDKIQSQHDKRADKHSDAIKEQAAATREQTTILSKKLDEIKVEACQYRHASS